MAQQFDLFPFEAYSNFTVLFKSTDASKEVKQMKAALVVGALVVAIAVVLGLRRARS